MEGNEGGVMNAMDSATPGVFDVSASPFKAPKGKLRPEEPKSLSAMNLAMSPEDEEVADAVSVAVHADSAAAVRRDAAAKAARLVRERVMALRSAHVLSTVEAALVSKAPGTRAGALTVLAALAELATPPAEPYLIPLVGACLDGGADKVAEVHAAALGAARAILNNMCPYGTRFVMPQIVSRMTSTARWQQKYAACVALRDVLAAAQSQAAPFLGACVPPLRGLMVDAREEVREAALAALQLALSLVGNRDLDPVLQDIVASILSPAAVPETITKLAATTFAQPIDDRTLAVMVPLLLRGLRERNTAIRRKTAVIVANMAKLVERAEHVAPFMPKLLPEIDKVSKEMADPEARAVAMATHAQLVHIVGSEDGRAVVEAAAARHATPEAVAEHMREELSDLREAGCSDTLYGTALAYVATMCTSLMDAHAFGAADWDACFTPYIGPFVGERAREACQAVLRRCHADVRRLDGDASDDEGGPDLCDCEFSLAYGGRILLSGAKLRLKRGQRYGLCGPNGAGKTTLMKAIANGQVEGFPDRSEVLTIYVAHDLQAQEDMQTVLEYLSDDALIREKGLSREACRKALEDIGFDETRLVLPIPALSGGWKMKLALARAMLLDAGLLLLDEPTNHMDTANVAWLIDYLLTCGITTIAVSHDSRFLDAVCTGIIHYENKKLVKYRGNLSAFVEQRPEARAYYELTDEYAKFSFPLPGPLEGVRSREKPVLKCKKMSLQYPGTAAPTLSGVSLKASMSARVAVLGPNGAGKSTLIKVLTGELKPTGGDVERHPNLRIAYIAQHAFHHLEAHLLETPVQYLIRRYEHGEDEEEAEKVFRKMSDEDKMKLQTFVIDGMERQVDEIKSRRKKKRDFEYEVSWKKLPSIKYNKWFTREELIKRGFGKMVAEFDGKLASAAGDKKALTRANVEAYLCEFGLDAELASHSHIKGLSGGQKVKLVLAAAMWNHPHFLIMDEPTNYLDRDSLGALAGAIRAFEGGVLLISHNSEFTSALCPEVWAVDKGLVTVKKAEDAKAGGEDGKKNGKVDER